MVAGRPGRTVAVRRLAPWPLAVVLVLCGAAGAAAQDVAEPSLKAAFIYNFARFTEWPVDMLAPNSPLTVCVPGETPVASALERTVKDRPVFGHTVAVVKAAPDAALRGCHLLYLSGQPEAQVTRLLAAARGLPVLTLVDIEGYPPHGGIVHLFVENGKVRFSMDLALARRSRLQLSSKLVRLATRVRDEGGAP